jgi:hypothetical protein
MEFLCFTHTLACYLRNIVWYRDTLHTLARYSRSVSWIVGAYRLWLPYMHFDMLFTQCVMDCGCLTAFWHDIYAVCYGLWRLVAGSGLAGLPGLAVADLAGLAGCLAWLA